MGIAYRNYTRPNGELRVSIRGETEAGRWRVLDAVHDSCAGTGLVPMLVPWDEAGLHSVRIKIAMGAGPQSVSRIGTADGNDVVDPTIVLVSLDHTYHELAHGLFAREHEHIHPGRGWDWQPWAAAGKQPKLSADDPTYIFTSYDQGSVSHYPIGRYQTVPEIEVGLGLTLSEGDRAMARLLNPPAAPAPVPDDERWIRRLYRDLLGREAEPAGLAYWLEQRKSSARIQVAWEFSQAAAVRAGQSARLYRDLLGREMRQGEEAHWTNHSFESILANILSSDEYYGRDA